VSLAHVLCRLGPFIGRMHSSKGSTPRRSARLHSRTNLSSSSTFVDSLLLAVFAEECADTRQQGSSSAGYTSQRLAAHRGEVIPRNVGQHHSVRADSNITSLHCLLMYYVNRRLHQAYPRLSTSQRSANSSQRHKTGNFWCVWIMFLSRCVAC